MNDTPTPRTDALWHAIDFGRPFLAELNDHSRQLEREIAEARVQLREEQHLHTATLNERDRLAEALERIDYCLSNAEDVMHGAGSDDVTIARRIIINALAAVKGETK